MPSKPSPRVIQLTPPGRGAIATLLVEGPGAVEAVEGLFRVADARSLAEHPVDRIVVGRFGEAGQLGERIVVCRVADDSIRLHCHGGVAAVARLEKTLLERGCQKVAWRDWAQRHEDDPIRAEARVALADARTERTAAILLDQYHGALRRELDAVYAALAVDNRAEAAQRIDTLLARATLGRHLVRPWRVVLAGRPNVGKSSLINAMLGYPRAIVHHAPGTTRDVLTAATALDGWPVELSDTAGLRRGKHPVERAGVQRAEEQLDAADLIVLVFDATEPRSESEHALLQSWPSALVVYNKCDLVGEKGDKYVLPGAPGSRTGATQRQDVPAPFFTSATSGQGIDGLLLAIVARLVPEPPPPGAAVPWTLKQIERLHLAADALAAGAPASAAMVLG